MTPLVSVVIPTYNRARDIERALKSVQAQTHANWEALIVDNHSSDNTEEVVKGFNDPRIRLFRIHNGGVVAVSRNAGINQALGEYIAFLDSDDWWLPRKLEESLKYLMGGADVVYHDLFKVSKAGQRIFLKKACTDDLKKPVFDDLIEKGNAITNSSVVVRRELLNSINGLCEDASLISIEDYDAWLRIAKLTDKFTKIHETLGYYWAGGGNISNPERTLKTADAVEARYADAIHALSAKRSIYWLPYVRGRAYFRLRSYEMAGKNLQLIRWRQAPVGIYFKSRWMLLLINLYRRGVS